jgi:hypothetical protein
MDGVTVTPKATPTATESGFAASDTLPIAGLLGLDTHNLGTTDSGYLQEIYDFIRGDAKEMTSLEVLAKVRNLENRLGIPGLGERRLDKVYRYVKLQSQISQLEKRRDGELR